MADVRKLIECSYCGASYHIKFQEDLLTPSFCAFCGEAFDIEVEDEDDDGDLDYTDEERDVEKYA